MGKTPRTVTITLDRDEMASRGRLGGLTTWSRTPDRTAATAPARQAFLDKFRAEVRAKFAGRELTEQQITDMAVARRRLFYARLTRASVLARQARAARKAAGDAA